MRYELVELGASLIETLSGVVLVSKIGCLPSNSIHRYQDRFYYYCPVHH